MISTSSHIIEDLSEWYQTAQGKEVLQQLDEVLLPFVSETIGHYSLELSYLDHEHRWYQESRIRYQFLNTPSATKNSNALCDFAHLPFESESVDSILVHHAFEFADDPYAIAREMHRVLIPEGRSVIISFNPFGIYGLRKHFRPRLSVPWGGNFFSMSRVKEWFSVLGFAVDEAHYVAPLGFHVTRDKKYCSWLVPVFEKCVPFTGGLFVLIVRKQVTQPIMMKKPFRPSALFKGRVVQPTASGRV